MRKIFFLLLPFVLIITTCEKKDEGPNPNDIVNIPDNAFLNALIDIGVDNNGDGVISYAEAEAITTLIMEIDPLRTYWHTSNDPKGTSAYITDMTGIEAFINLDSLNCSGHCLTELDVSKNTKLTYLDCNCNVDMRELNVTKNTKLKFLDCSGDGLLFHVFGSLETLDISNNISLENLYCKCQHLKSLDVTKNIALIELNCGGNQELTSLDVSKNIALKELLCIWHGLTTIDLSSNPNLTKLDLSDNPYWEGNSITELNLSNNNNLEALLLKYMPTLNKVCVWTMPFPPAEFYLWTEGSPDIYYTTDCSK